MSTAAGRTVDEPITATVGASGRGGLTALDIETTLAEEVGPSKVHQTVTGNSRHLVERGHLVQVRGRYQDGYVRHVYVTPENYSAKEHGPRVDVAPRPQKQLTAELREEFRRKVQNARPDSVLIRVRDILVANTQGLTCREIENVLGESHQTVSARLAELRKAGVVEQYGECSLPGESKPQPVWHATIMTELNGD